MKTHQQENLGSYGPECRRIAVWDAPTRLFHWGIVFLVAASMITSRLNWLAWHANFGRILLGLVVFRLIWGFVGSDTSLFRNFLTSPRAMMSSWSNGQYRQTRFRVGHSALGGWMVLYLLILLLVQALSGLYIYNDVAKVGPLFGKLPQTLAEAFIRVHVVASEILMLSIALHVLAISFYLIVKKRNVIVPMVSGRQSAPLTTPCPKLRGNSLAGGIAFLAAGIAYLLSQL
jgi:cytochrome b